MESPSRPRQASGGVGDSDAPTRYQVVLAQLKADIRHSRLRALQAANAEMLSTYWTIGRTLRELQVPGAMVIDVLERLATDLADATTGMSELTPANLSYVRRFAAAWPDGVAGRHVAMLPWGHVMLLLDNVEEPSARDAVAAEALEHNWTRDALEKHLEGSHPRTRRG